MLKIVSQLSHFGNLMIENVSDNLNFAFEKPLFSISLDLVASLWLTKTTTKSRLECTLESDVTDLKALVNQHRNVVNSRFVSHKIGNLNAKLLTLYNILCRILWDLIWRLRFQMLIMVIE